MSNAAIKALSLDSDTQTYLTLSQDKIREQELNVGNFFEEVPIKIHRSHLLQAFLFDHIAPKMPVFNTNLLAFGSTSQHMV